MYSKAAVLVSKGDKYLLVQEVHGYQGRTWNWPQGKIEKGESSEAAALREGREETGLELRIERKLTVLTKTFPDTKELHVFLASPLTDTLSLPEEEIRDAKWFSLEEMEEISDNLVGEWILKTVRAL